LMGHGSPMTPTRTDHGCLRYAKEESTSSSEILITDMALLPSFTWSHWCKGKLGSLTSGGVAKEKGIVHYSTRILPFEIVI
jgi:hypothetical protein